jgi:hypothetical protein
MLFSLTMTEAVSPIERLAGLSSVETNGPTGGVSMAADFTGNGTARASKHRDTIKILTAFDDILPPHICYQY